VVRLYWLFVLVAVRAVELVFRRSVEKTHGRTQVVLILTLTMVVASLMAILGTVLMERLYSTPLFGKYDLVLPSLLTWILLMWCLNRPSQAAIWIVGLGSPFVGAVWTLILKLGPAHEIVYRPGLGHLILGFVGTLFFYAVPFVFIYAPVTLTVGVATAFLIRGVRKIVNESR
jgi:hypothetical protein